MCHRQQRTLGQLWMQQRSWARLQQQLPAPPLSASRRSFLAAPAAAASPRPLLRLPPPPMIRPARGVARQETRLTTMCQLAALLGPGQGMCSGWGSLGWGTTLMAKVLLHRKLPGRWQRLTRAQTSGRKVWPRQHQRSLAPRGSLPPLPPPQRRRQPQQQRSTSLPPRPRPGRLCSCRRRAARATTGARPCSTWSGRWGCSRGARWPCWLTARAARCGLACARAWASTWGGHPGRLSGAADHQWRTLTSSACTTASCW